MSRIVTSRFTENSIGVLVAACVFTVYLTTICPTVNFIDSGELATVCYSLGIAHPTGYPLFTILGWVAAHLPLGFRVIYQLNVMAAVLCSSALFFFFKFLVFILQQCFSSGGSKTPYWVYGSALMGTLVLGFSETFWSQATAIEVYSLHSVFLVVLLFLFMKSLWPDGSTSDSPESNRRQWYGFAFVLGLAFTNHMTTILLAPAFLYLYFAQYRFTRAAWKKIARMVVPFLVGLSVYLYLPFRSGEKPGMNWGNPTDIERFLWHFTGKQYRVWVFSSTESAGRQLQYFIDTIPSEFMYLPLVLAVIGLWSLFKRNRKFLVGSLLLFIGCIFYSINYDIHDIDSYFLLAYITVALWCTFGFYQLLIVLKRIRVQYVALILMFAFVIIMGIVNYSKVDESDMFLVEDYTRDMFRSIDQNGLVISYQWDYFVSAAYYFQIVENERPDIVVIDKELLRRSWYYDQLEHRYPWLIARSRREVTAFLAELYKFEHGLPYDPNTIELRFREVIHSFLIKNMEERPIYATGEIEPAYISGFNKVPSGIPFRLYSDTLVHDVIKPSFAIRHPIRADRYVNGIYMQYAQSYLNHAISMYFNGNVQVALQSVEKALQLQPTMADALYLKQRISSGRL